MLIISSLTGWCIKTFITLIIFDIKLLVCVSAVTWSIEPTPWLRTRSLSVGNYQFVGKKLPVCRQVSGGLSATLSLSDAKVLHIFLKKMSLKFCGFKWVDVSRSYWTSCTTFRDGVILIYATFRMCDIIIDNNVVLKKSLYL